jgi:hypothetical protein
MPEKTTHRAGIFTPFGLWGQVKKSETFGCLPLQKSLLRIEFSRDHERTKSQQPIQ